MVRYPLTESAAGRILAAPVIRSAVAGAWGPYWNDLAFDALPGPPSRLAKGLAHIAAARSRSDSAEWFARQFAELERTR